MTSSKDFKAMHPVTTYFYDKDGKLIGQFTGEINAPDREMIDTLVDIALHATNVVKLFKDNDYALIADLLAVPNSPCEQLSNALKKLEDLYKEAADHV